jgi:hypothetical protein
MADRSCRAAAAPVGPGAQDDQPQPEFSIQQRPMVAWVSLVILRIVEALRRLTPLRAR